MVPALLKSRRPAEQEQDRGASWTLSVATGCSVACDMGARIRAPRASTGQVGDYTIEELRVAALVHAQFLGTGVHQDLQLG